MRKESLENIENNKEKIKRYIIDFLKQPLIYLLIVIVFIQLKIYNDVPKYHIMTDTKSYEIAYNENNILKGELNESRTPVYPYIIKTIKYIGGEENAYINIANFQKILFIVTVILFYYSVQIITKNNIIKIIATLIFGICPYIILWNVNILTESVSIFEMVLLAFLTLKYLKSPKRWLAIGIRNNNISYDNDETIIYIFGTNIFGILDIKNTFRKKRKKKCYNRINSMRNSNNINFRIL